MIFALTDVLTAEELTKIVSYLEEAEFVDGKLTAGWHAQLVKNNQQLKVGSAKVRELTENIKAAFSRHPLFTAAVRPKLIHSLLFSRYQTGMYYDRHIDNALMGNANLWRADVSFTLFLNSPSSYEGGELVIESAADEKAYKLEAGSALVYPSTTLHRVNQVNQGTRLVAVGWVQSLIRDASEREILFDLETVRHLIFKQEGKTAEFDLISKTIANLLRKWADL